MTENELKEFCLHAWNRKDAATMKKRKEILMTFSDAQNCTFKPQLTYFRLENAPWKKEEEIFPQVITSDKRILL
jgi:hypothetical protein